MPAPNDYVDSKALLARELQIENKELHINSTLCIAEMDLPMGVPVGKHVHPYDHFSMLGSGKGLLQKFHAGESEPFEVLELDAKHGPVVVEVKANIYHRFLPLSAAKWFCIHANSGG